MGKQSRNYEKTGEDKNRPNVIMSLESKDKRNLSICDDDQKKVGKCHWSSFISRISLSASFKARFLSSFLARRNANLRSIDPGGGEQHGQLKLA